MIQPVKSPPNRMLSSLTIAVGFCVLIAAATAVRAERVVLTGLQVDFGDVVNRSGETPVGMPAAQFTVDDLCAAEPAIGNALNQMLNAVDSAAASGGAPITLSQIQSIPGAPNRFDIGQDLANVRDLMCGDRNPEVTVQAFTITYSACEMSMTTPTHAMVIYMDGDRAATMLIADHAAREVMHMELTSHIDRVSDVVGSGWSDGINMVSLNETAQIFGYDTELYRFNYTTGLGDAEVGAASFADFEAGRINSVQRFGNLVSVTTEGTVRVSSTAPGVDIAQSFYRNLASRFQPGESTSFFGGMIQNLVGMLDRGLPIVIEQTTSASVMGRTSVSGRSESHIANIRVLEGGGCGGVEFPPNYTVTNVNDQMSAATAGGDAASQAEMQEAMRQASEAMEQMTPEQRQMMESLGLGSMMPGGMGAGTTPAQSQGARSSAPASSDLRSGDLTTSVQRHLQALGYDVGSADGSLSLETQIAVSTFQAEQGLEVTGDVTPQLLGILSAEVDRRR